MTPSEIIFEVTEAAEGGYNARASGYSIFTQGEDWTELKEMVKEATRCHFGDECRPKVIRLAPLQPPESEPRVGLGAA